MILDVCLASPPERLDQTPSGTGYFDLDNAPFPWSVSTYSPGDRMIPLGMSGSKKVKNIFVDKKIPRVRRNRIPLVFSNGTLIWICGICFSNSAALSGSSLQIARAQLLQQSPNL
jgi:tRNA(Ile)-lysidine synthase